jgi:hypothetical protein
MVVTCTPNMLMVDPLMRRRDRMSRLMQILEKMIKNKA